MRGTTTITSTLTRMRGTTIILTPIPTWTAREGTTIRIEAVTLLAAAGCQFQPETVTPLDATSVDARRDALLDGAGDAPLGRTDTGLIVLYDFEEGAGFTVGDSAGGTPLDLAIMSASPGAYAWVADALVITGDAQIRSPGAATKIYDAVTDELTVEAWVRPASLTVPDGAPARIVTSSLDITDRNFLLGQDGDRWQARLRTTMTSADGAPYLSTTDPEVTTSVSHVLFTREANGARRLYVDGALASAESVVGGDFSSWDVTLPLILANEGSGTRDFQGELHLIAIYARALTVDEVARNFAAGPLAP
jgi:hypothetical protein